MLAQGRRGGGGEFCSFPETYDDSNFLELVRDRSSEGFAQFLTSQRSDQGCLK